MSISSTLQINSQNKTAIIRIAIISILVIGSQNLLPTPKAEANVLFNATEVVASNIVWQVATNACGLRCAVPATFVTVVATNYAPAAAEKSTEYVKPGLIEMFTNWGTSFFRY